MCANPRTAPTAIRRKIDAIFFMRRVLCALVGAAIFFPAMMFHAQGQDDATQAQMQTMVATYQSKQAGLAQERQALVDGGATVEQLQAWRQQNGTRFDAQQRRAQKMSQLSFRGLRPVTGAALIPAAASSGLAAALTTRAALVRAHAQLHNQLVQTLPANATADQISQMQGQERQLFQQQHGAELELLSAQSQALSSASSASPMIVPMPPALQLPANATPQLSAYLVTRDQLMRERLQLRNQYAAADPATRQAALQQWRQQKASLLQQLQQQAQVLATDH